jgi:8-oxo-dGTP diphosphatase
MQHQEIAFRFCPACGGKLDTSRPKENEPPRLVCSACDFIFYLDPKVVACSILELDGKLVLLKRGVKPQKGKWVIPGGYVDRGEAVEAAAIRETVEECGIRIQIKELLGVYSYSGHVPVVIVYVAEYLSGDLSPGDEAVTVELFSQEQIPWDQLAFESTKDALRDYYKLKKDGKEMRHGD